ncbi:hypothetical protein RN001_010399 [Aquatica leii]|uniref:Uncharacterized protein n=1 Tax=Aquatica leii TaxID=1421715 RepID=A0AAN7QHF5_9COLE|nr:hypothetical protein RN001_010399 [Aquatica leii]
MSGRLSRSLPQFGGVLLVLLTSIASSHGGCTFPEEWSGRWFQSGVPTPLLINRTHIETKGDCYEEQGEENTKFLVYDKLDNCYRCMAIHSKHATVLQYKETFCERSLQELCLGISGDAPLYSMFRKHPEAKPVSCPFKSAPFMFIYNRGSGDCINPPSKAESCTDDSRLVLKYQACHDVPSTESNVEELVCLATWKEGSTRYLLGRLSQGNRRTLTTDEDQYRCFIYQRKDEGGKTVYYIAQSGDATCNGVQNALEGSRTMKFITMDNHHNRCKFPQWITEHHTWSSLDHKKIYKFSQRNATLKIVDEEVKPNRFHQQQQNYIQPFGFQQNGFESQDQHRQNSEMRVVCHNILLSVEHKKVQIVAHITAGCDSGYVCMMFYKRDGNVIELQQSERYEDNPDDACRYFNAAVMPYTTLISHVLHPKKCPLPGRFNVVEGPVANSSRKRRQQPDGDVNVNVNCPQHDYESLAVGCNSAKELMEFKSSCAEHGHNAYTCLGSWQENDTHYVIASPVLRKSSDVAHYCFIYNSNGPVQSTPTIGAQRNRPSIVRITSMSETCHRNSVPESSSSWSLAFVNKGPCAEVGAASVSDVTRPSVVSIALLVLVLAGVLR